MKKWSIHFQFYYNNYLKCSSKTSWQLKFFFGELLTDICLYWPSISFVSCWNNFLCNDWALTYQKFKYQFYNACWGKYSGKKEIAENCHPWECYKSLINITAAPVIMSNILFLLLKYFQTKSLSKLFVSDNFIEKIQRCLV